MYPGIHNFSEIGKLNKVLLHRPGKELEALTPATLERPLFDDVSLYLNERERIGVIGVNGTGKSSLTGVLKTQTTDLGMSI